MTKPLQFGSSHHSHLVPWEPLAVEAAPGQGESTMNLDHFLDTMFVFHIGISFFVNLLEASWGHFMGG